VDIAHIANNFWPKKGSRDSWNARGDQNLLFIQVQGAEVLKLSQGELCMKSVRKGLVY
jgi:hypothetical protein